MNDLIRGKAVKITQRPNPIPYNYRLSYKVAQVCLIIAISGGRSISMNRLQLLAGAMFSRIEENKVVKILEGKYTGLVIRYDPLVNKAVDFAFYEGLVIQQQNKKYKLSDKGKAYVKAIMGDMQLLLREKEFLHKYAKELIEGKIEQLMFEWRY